MKRATFIILACAVALAQLALGGSPGGRIPGKGGLQKVLSPTTSGDFTVFDVNRVKTFVRNNGSFDRDPGTGNSGYEWPKGSGNTAIYASGLWLGAKSNVDGIVRAAVAEYSYEYDAGPILAGGVPADPGDSRYRMYKIKRGDNASTNPDYANWPVADGAPVDALGNPLVIGDMTVWCVFNEADPSVHVNMNAPPLGVEVQMTMFAFNRADALGDVLFFKWKIINKVDGTSTPRTSPSGRIPTSAIPAMTTTVAIPRSAWASRTTAVPPTVSTASRRPWVSTSFRVPWWTAPRQIRPTSRTAGRCRGRSCSR